MGNQVAIVVGQTCGLLAVRRTVLQTVKTDGLQNRPTFVGTRSVPATEYAAGHSKVVR